MLKWLSTLLPQKSSSATDGEHKPLVISEAQHKIARSEISHNAITVMENLNAAGYAGYLVGGGVRDLLLEGSPKDFDVATDATPEQVRQLFRNSRIIGRRFKIVHVRYGREIIEVTTFRGQDKDSTQQVESETGQLLRDNVYGDLESDALRRDFTANALYYSAADSCLYDFADGLQDIQQRQIRMIGDPATRYKEDPVRLLRAVRFAAKLGFAIEPNTAKPIAEQAQLLTHIPPARLFEEVLKLFLGGYATATFEELVRFGLFAVLFPEADRLIQDNPLHRQLIERVMANTDKRIRAGKRITPAFIYATLLWPALQETMESLKDEALTPQDRFFNAAQSVINAQLHLIMIPKRFLIPMRQIWDLQHRLGDRSGKKAYRTLQHPKFRAAYDFLLLREDAGEMLDGLGAWWTQFQHASEQDQEQMLAELKNTNPKPRRKRRPKKKPPADQANPTLDSHND